MHRTQRERNLPERPLVAVANSFISDATPPRLSACIADTSADQIRRAFRDTRGLKSPNTMGAIPMVNPTHVSGEHDVFIRGNDAKVNASVVELLHSLG
jgi:hypothetical protein